MTEKTLLKADFYTSIVLMASGIVVTVMAFQMPVMHEDPYSSPGVLPGFLGAIITALSFVMFIRSIIKTRFSVGVPVTSVKSFLHEIATRRMIITIILCVLYVFFLGKVFFPLLTFLYILLFIVIFEYDRKISFRLQKKKLLIAAAVALCSSVSIMLIFQYLFLVRLP